MSKDRVALVTGSTGIIGTAIVQHLLSTSADQWDQVIGTARGRSSQDDQWQQQDSRYSFVALDLTVEEAELVKQLETAQEAGVKLSGITHAFFQTYIHRQDLSELREANCNLLQTFVKAISSFAPGLTNVTLQTGGKYYNMHLQPPAVNPIPENLDRVPAGITNFYWPQEDSLKEASARSKAQGGASGWSWNVIRPMGVIGWTRKPNGMNMAHTLALYILVCKEMGLSSAPLPTNEILWKAQSTNSYAPQIAKHTVWAATNPECKDEAFNSNTGHTFRWCDLWPKLTGYFGMQDEGPERRFTGEAKADAARGKQVADLDPIEWASDKKAIWSSLCHRVLPNSTRDEIAKKTLLGSWDFATWDLIKWGFNWGWEGCQSNEKNKRLGWVDEQDDAEAFFRAFGVLEEQGLLPPRANP